jgi:mono/diheme cytochrome c family protein
MRIKITFALIVMCPWIGTAVAQSPRIGLALVQEHCAMCHAIGKADDSPHPGAPPLRSVGTSYNLDEFAELLERGIIIAPHPAMPACKFGRRDARAITTYLRSIQE